MVEKTRLRFDIYRFCCKPISDSIVQQTLEGAIYISREEAYRSLLYLTLVKEPIRFRCFLNRHNRIKDEARLRATALHERQKLWVNAKIDNPTPDAHIFQIPRHNIKADATSRRGLQGLTLGWWGRPVDSRDCDTTTRSDQRDGVVHDEGFVGVPLDVDALETDTVAYPLDARGLQLRDLCGWKAVAEIDGDGTDFFGFCQTRGDPVDGVDFARTPEDGGVGGEQAHRTGTIDGHHVPGLEPGLGDGPPSRGENVRQQDVVQFVVEAGRDVRQNASIRNEGVFRYIVKSSAFRRRELTSPIPSPTL